MKFLFFTFLILLNSCFVLKAKNNKINVKGKIEIHKPYCGGAKPDEEMLKGVYEPYSNSVFYLKKVMNNDKNLETVLTFTTDENGFFEFKTEKGYYVVIQEDKTLIFEKYVEKYGKSTNKFFQYIGDELARKEYERFDFEMEVSQKKEFNQVYKTRCFVGLNPLLRYDGPPPR
jgi:hypothetical protein